MKKLRILAISLLLLQGFCSLAQSPDPVYNKLVKRYGNVTPWANGYIIKVKSYYGFANSNGLIVIPVSCIRFDTLLNNRAGVKYQVWGAYLIDENGKTVATASGTGTGFRLVSRRSRLLLMGLDNGRETLCDDKGQKLMGLEFSSGLPKEARLGFSTYKDKKYKVGIINLAGDTILPPEYNYVSIGHNLHAGFRNDTAFVFKRNKSLLLTFTGTQSCWFLANDFIAVQKYGTCALANNKGRLLTGFRYAGIQSLAYKDSVAYDSLSYFGARPKSSPRYFLTGHEPYGLIDSSGREVLPAAYEKIAFNSNGWFAVKKMSGQKEELLNSGFQPVLQTEPGGITFLNKRYVKITAGHNTAHELVKYYDMELNRFTEEAPMFKSKVIKKNKQISSENNIYDKSETGVKNRDSIVINEAGSALIRKKGRWGLRSITGDTVLPFIYDTAFQNGAFYVGINGKIAPLNWDGTLTMPAGLTEVPQYWSSADSLVVGMDRTIYTFKGWHLRKAKPLESNLKDPYLHFTNGIAQTDGNNLLKRGLYNRQLKWLGLMSRSAVGYPSIKPTGIVTIEDSANKLITVVDSTGRQLMPWIKEPTLFTLKDHYALALNNDSKTDVLYRFENQNTFTDSILVDTLIKKYLLNDQHRGYMPNDNWPVKFELPGYGKSILTNKPVMLIKGVEVMSVAVDIVLVKANGKWGMYNTEKKQLLAPVYDSIDAVSYTLRLIIKNRKMGFYDLQRHKIIEPKYDSVYYQDSYFQNYFIGFQSGQASFVSLNGPVISRGWNSVKRTLSYSMAGMQVSRNGKTYLIFPTLGDSLIAEPYTGLPANTVILKDLMNGLAIVANDARQGLYDKLENSWLIPAEYSLVQEMNDHFIATNSKPESFTLFTAKGQKMFSLRGSYHDPTVVHQNQWRLWGPKGYFVLNSKGKIIVPDTFEMMEEMPASALPMYKVLSKKNKFGLIDTSGRIIVPPVMDDVEAEWRHNDYAVLSKAGKKSLLGPRGKALTGFVYKSITDGNPLNAESTETCEDCPPEVTAKKQWPFFLVTGMTNGSLKYGLLDKNGTLVIPCVYDELRGVEYNKIVLAKKGNYWGLISINNKPLTGFIYDWVEYFENGQAQFSRKKKQGYISIDGKEL